MSGWPLASSPYHAGEIAVQTRAGAREAAEHMGRQVIRDAMPDQHRVFFSQLPYLAFAALDTQRRPWAGLLAGQPGFAQSTDPHHLDISAWPATDDPAAGGLHAGAPVGLVGVEMHTRRRNRMNGRISSLRTGGFSIEVAQSFGNCPQYIQAREPLDSPDAARLAVVHRLTSPEPVTVFAARADMAFIASASPEAGTQNPVEGVDVNYRGGRPGFLRLEHDGARAHITFPDFVGNLAFNTLGNIQANPRAGLLVPDFTTGDAISLTGEARIIWEGADLAQFRGAERLVRITLDEVFLLKGLLPAKWSAPRPAAQLDATGTWQEVERAQAAGEKSAKPRLYRVVTVKGETARVRSLELVPVDGQPLQSFRPGQFLPVVLDREPAQEPLRAAYSLSRADNGIAYRISVARCLTANPNSVSQWLHDRVQPDTLIRALPPAGNFILDPASRRSVLLIGGGIGITPLLAMAEYLCGGTQTRQRFPSRRIQFLHAVRHSGDHPFREEILAMARVRTNLNPVFIYSDPTETDIGARAAHVFGRLDKATLRDLLPFDDYDAYLYGPSPFIHAVHDALLALGVAEERIHAETFGPASLRRGQPSSTHARAPHPLLVTEALDVLDTTRLTAALSGHPVVISAFNPGKDTSGQGFASILAAVSANPGQRLLVVGGAGSLEVAPGKRLVDQPDFPAQWKEGALKTAAVLDFLRGSADLDWTFISPAAMLSPGLRTASYRTGGDTLLKDAAGESRISVEDYAVAMLDEAEQASHPRQRIGVAY